MGGILFGLYLGIWVLFAGGIVDIVRVVIDYNNGGVLQEMQLVWGIVKILVAAPAGWIVALILISIGSVISE